MIKQLFNEFVKNIKIMFRNWTSLMLLVIVPLIMILIIGYAFSNEEVTGIKLGIVTADNIDLRVLEKNISSFAELNQFTELTDCIQQLQNQKLHLCVQLENVELDPKNITNIEDFPTGKVTYYYDNSRKKLSLAIIQNMQTFFGVKAEQMSIETTSSILENIQRLISFINDRRADIELVKTESKSIKNELIERKARLEEVRNNFMPSYLAVKDLQAQIHNYSEGFNNSALQVYDTIGKASAAINDYRTYISSAPLTSVVSYVSNLSALNITNITLNMTQDITQDVTQDESAANISQELLNITNITNLTETADQISGAVQNISETTQNILQQNTIPDELAGYTANLSIVVDQLDIAMTGLANATNATMDQLNTAVAALDAVVAQLDEINITLEEEIRRSDEYIFKIDKSVEAIDKASQQLDEKLSQLSKLQPSYAEKIIRPLTYNYEMLLRDIKNIQISFPSLLAIIIMFIAVLFSNIIVLMEIHNKAALRNSISPINDIVFMLGMIITASVLILFQVMVLLVVAQTKFSANVTSVFWQLGIVCLLLILVYVLVGMIIAYVARNVQTSILITTFFVLALFMFSNAIVPIEAMPASAAFISSHNPMVVGEFLIKQIQLFNTPLELLMPNIMLLVGYNTVLFLIAIVVIKQENKGV